MEEIEEEILEEVITIKKDDYEFLKKCVIHFRDLAEEKEMELEDIKKQLEPQSLDLDLSDIDLESLRDVVLPPDEDNSLIGNIQS